MEDSLHPALLPVGLRDILPPDAQIEADVESGLLAVLARYGYQRVKPPLMEFETSLLSGAGAAMAPDTLRLMDPISQRMIGIRADMTLQVARIATTRLIKSPRPLRLSYAGPVLRVRGSQLRPEREFGQVGAELIGADAPSADAEVISLAAEALVSVGVSGLSVDLTVPKLVDLVLDALEIRVPAIRAALDHKDTAQIEAIAGAAAPLLVQLIQAAGPASRALAQMAGLPLPDAAKAEVGRLAEILGLIQAATPDLTLTIDPVENRGFEYHTGVSFTLFARGIRGELGRGGRYQAGGNSGETSPVKPSLPSPQEPATGFTLYTDTVLRAVPAAQLPHRVFLPFGTPRALGLELRAAGWITLAGLDPTESAGDAAVRLGCSHILGDGGPHRL